MSAFTTMTKSPMSELGVNVGLCLPRRTSAIFVAIRPSTFPSASTTYHVWSAESLVSIFVVFIAQTFPLKSKDHI